MALVADLLRAYPAIRPVLQAARIDTSRSGLRPLRDVAHDSGVNCCALLAECEWAIGGADAALPPSASADPGA